MKIDTFKIEDWMNKYCPNATYDLTTSCIEPMSIRELLNVIHFDENLDIFDKKLTYGDIWGSLRLKNAIKSLYINQDISNITVVHGGIGANQLVYEALLEDNDEVLAIVPTYQQLYTVPKTLGAKVNFLYLREENNWLPSLKELEKNITSRTRIICINNPNNPTGSVIPDDMLKRIIEVAEYKNCWILCDEVYRGTNLQGESYSQSIADLYEKGISTGSMSKTYSLPGLRLGWICARGDLINEINKHREYNTISISLLDDYFASIALERRQYIAKRNQEIMQKGLEVLENWLNTEIYIKANMPQGGTTAFIRYKKEIPSKVLCKDLLKHTGVLMLPGETMEMENFLRVGYCINPKTLENGLKLFSKYIRECT